MSKLITLLVCCLFMLFFSSPVVAYPGGGAKPAPDSATATNTGNVGTIVQTMDSGGYTYALIESGNMQNWVAMPQTELSVGDQVEVRQGMPMNNFTSKTLNRTFETIYFTQGVVKR